MTEKTYVNPALYVHGRLVTTAAAADLSNPQICPLVGLANSFCGQAVVRNICQNLSMVNLSIVFGHLLSKYLRGSPGTRTL